MTDTLELVEKLKDMARDAVPSTALAPVLAEAADRLEALYYTSEQSPLKPIDGLGNDSFDVILLRRTGVTTVKSAIGRRDKYGELLGWSGVRPPTHWAVAPRLESRK